MFSQPEQIALINKIKAEIKQAITDEKYEKIDPIVIDDFAKIAVFLREVTPTQIAELFKGLSDELEKRYAALDMIEKVKKPDGSIDKHIKTNAVKVHQHKVFTEVIENWAKDKGLNQGAKAHCIVTEDNKQVRKLINLPAKIPTIFGFLGVSAFRGLLSAGYVFKDVGIGKEHGEFTHLLAIYLIIEANRSKPFLAHNPVHLYKMLGNELCFRPGGTRGVWDIVFDVIASKINNSPEEFSRLLREDLKKDISVQILTNMLQRRYDKRLAVEGISGGTKKSGEKAAEKFKDAPGIFIDEKIFFSLPYKSSQLKACYDEVADVCHYDAKLKDKYPIPAISITKDSLLIDKLIALFNSDNWQLASITQNTKELAKKIQDKLLQMKETHCDNGYLPHRKIAEALEELIQTKLEFDEETLSYIKEKNIYQADDYINFLINESKKILLDHDLKDPEENLIHTQELTGLESELRGFKY